METCVNMLCPYGGQVRHGNNRSVGLPGTQRHVYDTLVAEKRDHIPGMRNGT